MDLCVTEGREDACDGPVEKESADGIREEWENRDGRRAVGQSTARAGNQFHQHAQRLPGALVLDDMRGGPLAAGHRP